MTDTCRTCIHHAPSPELNLVECRRNPPTFIATTQGLVTGFPQPRADWWCGEYTPNGDITHQPEG